MDLEKPLLPYQNSDAKNQANFISVLIAGIFCTFLLCLLFIASPSIFKYLDYKLYDTLLQSSANPQNSKQQIIIIDIDEKSLKNYGQWPWPRYLIAELLDKTSRHLPKSITLDVIFSEPDRTSIGPLIDSLTNKFDIDVFKGAIPGNLLDNDKILSRTLANGPYVLSTKFHFDETIEKSENCSLHPVNIISSYKSGAADSMPQLYAAQSILCNVPDIDKAVVNSGFFNVNPDRDDDSSLI